MNELGAIVGHDGSTRSCANIAEKSPRFGVIHTGSPLFRYSENLAFNAQHFRGVVGKRRKPDRNARLYFGNVHVSTPVARLSILDFPKRAINRCSVPSNST